ncbi:acyl-CoA reductase-like NAD-dependent aldehyde dehydrogenase, partial [Sphingobium jiangsuense]|nr:acyl-CoA reductase-like NAD-dependent aldehyde dehydrogenase [Sphingobium jiangsuense]
MTDDPGAILESQRAQSRDPSPVSAALRKDRLRRAIEALSSHESRFCHALAEDFGVRAREQSQLYDIVASLQTLRHTLKHVDRWMRPERRPVDMALRLFGAVRRQNIWHNSRRKLAECGPRPGVDIKRRSCG